MSEPASGICIDSMRDPACFPHDVHDVEVLETHGNWIVLAGEYAYKIKKPVDFGFMNFSSLERRRFYCEEELRLNRRLAPDLYHRVVPITGSFETPRIDGKGEALEYAVVMTRFEHAQRLDAVLRRDELTGEALERLGREIAAFHSQAPATDSRDPYSTPEQLHGMVADNFRDCRKLLKNEDQAFLAKVEAVAEEKFRSLEKLLSSRVQAGCIRECHGDLHLGNLVFHEGRIQAFDCIEFNPEFRWIDTANEAAFLSMDLRYRGCPELAGRWLNAYLEHSGDYEAVPLLGFYESYRAMIRTKVALLRAEQQPGTESAERERQSARDYMKLAHERLQPGEGGILLMMGLSASGKSRLARELVPRLPALCLRSDVERKRLFGLDPLADSGARLDAGIYSAEATQKTYQRLAGLAVSVANAGWTVIIDATFLSRSARDRFRTLAAEHELAFGVIQADAPLSTLEERIRKRKAAGTDASEADVAVLHRQLERMDPLDPEERQDSLIVPTDQEVDYAMVCENILRLIRAR